MLRYPRGSMSARARIGTSKRGMTVIQTLAVVSILVKDQEKALDFYVNTLGFVKKADIPMGPDARWLTVAPSDNTEVEIALVQPNMTFHGEKLMARLLKRVGHNPTWSYGTDDCRKTYEEYKARGVKFTSPPTEQMYGIEAVCQDLYGNSISIVQPSEWAQHPK